MYNDIISLKMMFTTPLCIIEKPQNLTVSLEDILTQGTIQGVRRFSELTQATYCLPTPDGIEYYSDGNYDLCYGDITFVMEDEQVAKIEIPVDESFIVGGDNCDVDFWEFEDYDEITLFLVEGILTNNNLDFSVAFCECCYETVELTIPQSGVVLTFEATDSGQEPYSFELVYITI